MSRRSTVSLRKTSVFLTEAQFAGLYALAERNATNISQLIRDFVREGLRRAAKQAAING